MGEVRQPRLRRRAAADGLPLACVQPQALNRRDFASEADWEEYQASGMPSRQAEGRAKVVSRLEEVKVGGGGCCCSGAALTAARCRLAVLQRLQQKESQKEKNKLGQQLDKVRGGARGRGGALWGEEGRSAWWWCGQALPCCLVLLLQIQKIMEEKGHDHAGAFSRSRLAEELAADDNGGGEGAGSGQPAAPAMRKKRRI